MVRPWLTELMTTLYATYILPYVSVEDSVMSQMHYLTSLLPPSLSPPPFLLPPSLSPPSLPPSLLPHSLPLSSLTPSLSPPSLPPPSFLLSPPPSPPPSLLPSLPLPSLPLSPPPSPSLLPPSLPHSLPLSLPLSADIFEDLISPLVAAQHFVTQACTKRKGVLDPVLGHCISILNAAPEIRDYRKKDGALHVIGSVYEVLMKVCVCGGWSLVVCVRVGGGGVCACVRVCVHSMCHRRLETIGRKMEHCMW